MSKAINNALRLARRYYAEGGDVEDKPEPFEANYPEPQVSEEDLALAQYNKQAAPREPGVWQNIPKAWEMLQTPEGRGRLGAAAAKFAGVHPEPFHMPSEALTVGTPTEETKAPLQQALIDPITEMVKGPGEAMQGRMTPEQQADWAAGTALNLIGGGTFAAHARPTGDIGVFGGRGSATADHTMLAKAETMEKAGVDRDKIWNETGWGRDASGEWMYHQDVSNAKLAELPQHPYYPDNVYIPEGKAVALPKILKDPELYKAYPFLKDYLVVGHDELGATDRLGMHMEKQKSIAVSPQQPESMFNTLIHEVNHAIQSHEGFALGGSETMFLPRDYQQQALALKQQEKLLNKYLKQQNIPVKDAWNAMHQAVYDPASLQPHQENLVQKVLQGGRYASMSDFIEKTRDHFDLRQEARDNYLKLAGEIGSRNAEFRARLNPEESRQTTPWASQVMMRHPVKPGEEIVAQQSSGPQLSTRNRRASEEYVDELQKPEPPELADQMARALIERYGGEPVAIRQHLEGMRGGFDPATVDKIDQALQRQGLAPPRPNQSMSPTEFAMARAESDWVAARDNWVRISETGTGNEARAAYQRMIATERLYHNARVDHEITSAPRNEQQPLYWNPTTREYQNEPVTLAGQPMLDAMDQDWRPVNPSHALGEWQPTDRSEWGGEPPLPRGPEDYGAEAPAAPNDPRPSRFNQEFDRQIAPHYPVREGDKSSFYNFFDDYFAGMFDPKLADEIHYEPYGGFIFQGNLRNKAGDVIGSISRDFSIDGKEAHHGFLKISPDARGTGLVPQMLENQINLYRKLGIERVRLSANIDVGSYSWAKYGWLPETSTWKYWAVRFKDHLDNKQVDVAGNYTKSFLLDILNNPDPRAMWVLSDMDALDTKSKQTIGKAMMMNKNWEGTLDLTDPVSLSRFYDYVSSRKLKAEQKKKSQP